LCDGDDTMLSPHLSVVALGCLDGGDKRGGGQGCYLRGLGQRPDTDTILEVELFRETMPQLARWQQHTLDKEQGDDRRRLLLGLGF
jgi:hypothetical protein